MDAQTVTQLVRDFGFPVFVAAYLLVRFDGLICGLTNEMRAQTELLKVLITRLLPKE
jgi:hypothetical protein